MSVKSSNYDNGSGSYYMVNNTSNKLFTWGDPDSGGSIEATPWSNQPDGVRINVKEAVMNPGGSTFFIELQLDGNGQVIPNEGKIQNPAWQPGYDRTTSSDTGFEKIYLAGQQMGFIAKKADNTFAGSLILAPANRWGNRYYIPYYSAFFAAVNNKKTLFFDVASNSVGAAVLFNDGTVISFGGGNVGFFEPVVQFYGGATTGETYGTFGNITGVSQIFAGVENFAALKSDGTITFWGNFGNYL